MAKDYETMTLVNHLEELRHRILWAVVPVAPAAVFGFTISGRALNFMVQHVEDLVVIHPAEAFFIHLRLAVWIGLVITSPITLYQIIAFISPALSRHEKVGLAIFLPFGLMLFVAGVAFSFFVIVPYVYRFYMQFTMGSLEAFITVNNYVSFVTGLLIPFGVTFELPILVSALTFLGLITPAGLRRNRKFAILAIFVMSAILTPPDIISQTVMSLPLIALFELSILISVLISKSGQSKGLQA